jgi:SAM-dependent methyltransferase
LRAPSAESASSLSAAKLSGETVRADFNSVESVLHYGRSVERVGLWASERAMLARYFPRKTARLLEAGCGTGRATLGLAELGFRRIVGFDFAEELLGHARDLVAQKRVAGIKFLQADATKLERTSLRAGSFDGVLFLFNGLMQIPGREHRRAALRGLHRLAKPSAPLLFTTHDRDDEPAERRHWKRQAELWAQGKQDPALLEFGDRYFVDDDDYRVFMHLPDRAEILADLAATGWTHEFDEMRRRIAAESKAVRDFSDECRFWVARKSQVSWPK